MKAAPRLYVDEPLCVDQNITLDRDAAHYVTSVMRRRVGDDMRLFNGRDGEWTAQVTTLDRKAASLTVTTQTRTFSNVPDLHLLYAPVKKNRSEFIVEKATELGVRAMLSIQTERTNARPLRHDRMVLIAREAAEQTERLDVPHIGTHTPLKTVLEDWDESRALYFCDEAGDSGEQPWGGSKGRARPMLDVLDGHQASQRKAAILIGPEGGFSTQERAFLRSHAFVHPVTLGPRILRADTAALAALTLWQSVLGDWSA